MTDGDPRSICPQCGVSNRAVTFHLNAPTEYATCGHQSSLPAIAAMPPESRWLDLAAIAQRATA